MTRTTASYSAIPPFGESIEDLANGDEERAHRARGTADLHDENGVVFGVAHWRAGALGDRWYARAVANAAIRTMGTTVVMVTRRLQSKIEKGRTT